jgi:TolA-binding protein
MREDAIESPVEKDFTVTSQIDEKENSATGEERPQAPKAVLFAVAAALVIVLAIGGVLWYRRVILPKRFLGEAERNFDAGDYQAALENYRKGLLFAPERGETLYRIGYSMEMLGDDSGAIDAYISRVKNEPDDSEALFRLGSLYVKHAMHREALEPLEMASKLGAPVSADYMLGVVREAIGNPKGAASSYRETIKGSRAPEMLYSSAMALMRLGYYEDALDGFTEMGKYADSGDMRPFHSVNAAKAMLGWPTDPGHVITPGKSIGSLALGTKSKDLLADARWGMPNERVSDGEYAIWGYGDRVGEMETLVYMEADEVIEIVTTAKRFRTSDGLGISNFSESKYAHRFDMWKAETGSDVQYRYTLKGGGLSFFSAGDDASAVVYSGDKPLSKLDTNEWIRLR